MTATTTSPDLVPERQTAYEALSQRDDGLARLVARDGTPDPFFWGELEDAAGGDAFTGLARRIVSHEISTAAALTIFGRLRDRLGGVVGPAAIIATSAEGLRAAGLSGAWSAQMFLRHNLGRPDIFPAADAGLLRAAQSAFGPAQGPPAAELAARAERWRPF